MHHGLWCVVPMCMWSVAIIDGFGTGAAFVHWIVGLSIDGCVAACVRVQAA